MKLKSIKEFLYPKYVNDFLIRLRTYHIDDTIDIKESKVEYTLAILYFFGSLFYVWYELNDISLKIGYTQNSLFYHIGIYEICNILLSIILVGTGRFKSKTIFLISCIPFVFLTYLSGHLIFSFTRWFIHFLWFCMWYAFYSILKTIINFKNLR